MQQSPDTGRYSLGVGLFSLGSLVRARLDVTQESKHALNELRDRTQENVRLAVLEHAKTSFFYTISKGRKPCACGRPPGSCAPAFCTAEGLCLIAGLRQPELDQFMTHAAAPSGPPGRSPIPDEFRSKLRSVRRHGYAFEDEECDEGTRCIAAPIYNAEGRIVASVGVAGPRVRIKKSQVPKLAPVVIAAADDISQRMGYIRRQPIYV